MVQTEATHWQSTDPPSSGAMSGTRKRSTGGLLRHRQTKGPDNTLERHSRLINESASVLFVLSVPSVVDEFESFVAVWACSHCTRSPTISHRLAGHDRWIKQLKSRTSFLCQRLHEQFGGPEFPLPRPQDQPYPAWDRKEGARPDARRCCRHPLTLVKIRPICSRKPGESQPTEAVH